MKDAWTQRGSTLPRITLMSECASVSAGSAKSGQSENSTKATPVSAGLTAQVVDRNAMVRIATLTSIDERTECTPCVNVTISNWLIFLRGGHCFALFLLPVRTQLKASKKNALWGWFTKEMDKQRRCQRLKNSKCWKPRCCWPRR